MKILPFFLCLIFAAPAFADTCKYEDADGRIIYTNVPIKGAKKLACFGFDGSPKDKAQPRVSQPSPANFPKIDPNTQKQRDDTRRKVLESELEAEQHALEEAKKAYEEGESDPETFKTTVTSTVCQSQTVNGKTVQVCRDVPKQVIRRNVVAFEEKMKKLQESVDLHQKNIEMLQKELASLK